ncbi:MAG: hypothetical protein II150_11845, partial [Thermoguttaceae bacterium]|nr:hypothetical protein [Thermoguttaceae bacterium]
SDLTRAAHGVAGNEVRRSEFLETVLLVFVQEELDEGAFQAGTGRFVRLGVPRCGPRARSKRNWAACAPCGLLRVG